QPPQQRRDVALRPAPGWEPPTGLFREQTARQGGGQQPGRALDGVEEEGGRLAVRRLEFAEDAMLAAIERRSDLGDERRSRSQLRDVLQHDLLVQCRQVAKNLA